MKRHTPALLLSAALLAGVGVSAQAQTKGGAVPPYQPPAQVVMPPQAVPEVTPSPDLARPDPFKPDADVMARFAEAYANGGRPRLAFYWNRQLSDTLAQWQSESRTVATEKSSSRVEGDLNLNQSGSRQSTVEFQRRTGSDQQRPGLRETWEWEFQDGFLGPFLRADAQVMDRTAILRIMGAGAEEANPRTVEIMALQNLADLLVEVLVADSGQSTTGYELRARILDMKTGRLLAMVNSRSLREWQPSGKAIATSRGFELPDEDDDSFGPERADQRFKATSRGFEQKRRPPKLSAIAHNLATNVMNEMIPRLGGAQAVAAPPRSVPAKPALPVKATPARGGPPSQSALPLPDVEAKPLTAPAKPQTVEPAPPGEEPPMPKPTRQ